MKKFRNKIKQDAYESYERNKTKTEKSFETLWNESRRNARKLYNFGKEPKYREISKNAQIFFEDELLYSNSGLGFNKALNDAKIGGDFKDKFENIERQIYSNRTKDFMDINGNETLKYGEEEKSLNEFMQDYKDKKIDKEVMNEIIKQYKEQNPDRTANYSDSNANNEDLQNYGFY